MTARILLDTNILIYAHDRAVFSKQAKALEVLDGVQETGIGLLTTQVLAEFFWVATRRLSPPLPVGDAASQVDRLSRAFPVQPVTSFVVLEALKGVRDHGMPYWDAQIWASARMNQIPVVFSEDFSHGSLVEGVRFLNPFVEDFRLAECLRD